MEFEERWSFYGEGCYIRCEGTFFIWVDSTCFTVYENLLGLKSHDHMNFLRVCMLDTRFS
jgi:hypothetical protein